MEYFITGIDTDIGKTFVTKGLALAFENRGIKTGVYKPLQSGAISKPDGFIAPDLYEIEKYSKTINTKCSYLLEGEVSPALAARLKGIKIDKNKIRSDFDSFKKENQITLVEGAGGILAPATDDMLFADLIKLLNIPVIIVSVPFLGRLNHTLLTVHYAKTNGINIKGIIINRVPLSTDDLAVKNFTDELKMYTDTPILGSVLELKNNDKESVINEFKKFTEVFS